MRNEYEEVKPVKCVDQWRDGLRSSRTSCAEIRSSVIELLAWQGIIHYIGLHTVCIGCAEIFGSNGRPSEDRFFSTLKMRSDFFPKKVNLKKNIVQDLEMLQNSK